LPCTEERVEGLRLEGLSRFRVRSGDAMGEPWARSGLTVAGGIKDKNVDQNKKSERRVQA